MARMVGPDGRRWRVGRRWLAWRPRAPWPLRLGLGLLFPDDPISAIVAAALLPLALLYVLSWTASLLLTPFAILGRAVLARPSPVVARVDGVEYRGGADGGHGADDLVKLVRDEIMRYGEPKSLAPPDPPLVQTPGPQGPPVLHGTPKWVRSTFDWMQLQFGGPPRARHSRPSGVRDPDLDDPGQRASGEGR